MGDTTQQAAAAPGPARNTVTYGLWPMIFLGMVNLVDQVDQYIIRGVAPVLQDEWQLGDFQVGLMMFVFVFVNALATIPAGWLADNLRRNRIIGYTLASWSGLLVLSATAVNYVHMLFARSVMGFGQAFEDPASTSMLGDFYPSARRARAFSLQQIAVFAGGGLGLALAGFVASTLHWRWAFILVGVPGSLLAFLALRLPEPRRGGSEPDAGPATAGAATEASGRAGGHAGDHGGQVTVTGNGHDTPGADRTGSDGAAPGTGAREPFGRFVWKMLTELRTEIRFIFGIRTMRYLLVGVSALLFTVAGVGSWLAFYHERYSDMSEQAATAFTGAVLGVGGVIGTLGGGWLSDRFLYSRGPASRVHLVVVGGCLCAVLFLVSFVVPLVPLRLLLQLVGVTMGASCAPGLRAAMLDVVPATSRGVGASAFSLCSVVLGTALAPPLVGLLSDLSGSLVVAFYIAFPPVIAGMLLLWRATHTIAGDMQKMLTALQQ